MEVLVANQKRKKKSKPRPDREQENSQSFAQGAENAFRCFGCAKKTCEGKNDCTHKNKPKSEWECYEEMEYADKHSAMFAQVTNDNNQEASSIAEVPSQSHANASSTNNNNEIPAWFNVLT